MVWAPRATVAAVVERGGRFLMVEEAPEGEPVFNQPAGHLEPGESLLQAVVREVAEETGLRFFPEALVGLYRWARPGDGPTYLRAAFLGRASEEATPRPADPDILAVHWLRREEIGAPGRRPRSPLVLRCIDDYLAGERYPLALLKEL